MPELCLECGEMNFLFEVEYFVCATCGVISEADVAEAS